MNKKILMGILGVAVSLMFSSSLLAQERLPAAPNMPAQQMKFEKFSGVVESVDMAKKDLVVEYHKDKMVFSIGDKTKLFEGKKEMNLSDLRKGLWASVQYNKEGNQLLAQTIHVSAAKKGERIASSEKTTEKNMTSTEKAPAASSEKAPAASTEKAPAASSEKAPAASTEKAPATTK